MAPVALAFAMLDLTGSTADLGIVLAVRQVAVVVLLLYGGVWADRLPRHLVMVCVEPRERAEPGHRRGAAALASRGHPGAGRVRGGERSVVGVLLPRELRNRPADRPGGAAPAGECDAAAGADRDEHQRRGSRRGRRRGVEPGLGDRRRRDQLRHRRGRARGDARPAARAHRGDHRVPRPPRRLARLLEPSVAVGDRDPVRHRQRGRTRERCSCSGLRWRSGTSAGRGLGRGARRDRGGRGRRAGSSCCAGSRAGCSARRRSVRSGSRCRSSRSRGPSRS